MKINSVFSDGWKRPLWVHRLLVPHTGTTNFRVFATHTRKRRDGKVIMVFLAVLIGSLILSCSQSPPPHSLLCGCKLLWLWLVRIGGEKCGIRRPWLSPLYRSLLKAGMGRPRPNSRKKDLVKHDIGRTQKRQKSWRRCGEGESQRNPELVMGEERLGENRCGGFLNKAESLESGSLHIILPGSSPVSPTGPSYSWERSQ